MKGIFVTGTDTGVGKTVVSTALMHRYRDYAKLRYWKPIQTGIERDDDTAEVARLGACSDTEIFARGIRLEKPVSPHLAARLAGIPINLPALRDSVPDESETRWIVEGAGGVLVPVNEVHFMADWMMMLGLPILVVARSGLGTINHTLLTIEALRTRLLKIAGVVMVGAPNAENRLAIERYGDIHVIGELPPIDPLTPTALNQWSLKHLDPEGIILGHIR
jgi:dethiobiotin synthetase